VSVTACYWPKADGWEKGNMVSHNTSLQPTVRCRVQRLSFIDRADRSLKLAWPSAIRPIGLRDEPIELDRRRSRSAYQAQSSRPRSFQSRLRFARSSGTENCIKMQFPPPADCGSSRSPLAPPFSFIKIHS
jgi:hypothetical protein